MQSTFEEREFRELQLTGLVTLKCAKEEDQLIIALEQITSAYVNK